MVKKSQIICTVRCRNVAEANKWARATDDFRNDTIVLRVSEDGRISAGASTLDAVSA